MTLKKLLFPAMMVMLPITAAFAEPYNDSDPDDYITERFDVRAVAGEDHTIDITENIVVDFIQKHHGIERYIPIAKDNTYIIKDLKVNGYSYNITSDTDHEILRAGDADKYLTGQHAYTITYKLQFFADTNEDADHLAYNIMPTGWATSIREANISLTMPSPIDWSQLEMYGGLYGATDNKWRNYFSYNIDEAANTIYIQGHDIPKHFGLTLRDIRLPNGYWQSAEPFELPLGPLMPLTALLAVFGPIGAVFGWIKKGRSPKIVKPVEFYPPDGITPAEIAYALDEEITNDEMMSMVLYFADKGYLRIHEYQKKKYEFIKERDIAESEPQFAKTLFNGLFAQTNIVGAASIPSSFYHSITAAKKQLEKSYKKERGDVISPSSLLTQMLIVIVMAATVFVSSVISAHTLRDTSTGLIMGGGAAGAILFASVLICTGTAHKKLLRVLIGIPLFGIILCYLYFALKDGLPNWLITALLSGTVIMMLIAMFSRARTKENAVLIGKVLGFREFLRTAEIDRLKVLMDTDPQYCYTMLPYAAVLGLDTAWAKKLTQIQVPKPDWYDTYEDRPFVYSSGWSHSLTHSCIHGSIPLDPDRSSGGGYSGGSSGGGFSGGGGGGGGGGAW